jgi:hypothetical protein
MQDFIEEAVSQINQAGFGSLLLAEYLVFEEIVEQYEMQLVSFQEGIEMMIDAAREIYWDDDYDPSDSGWNYLCERLSEVAPERFTV